MIASKGNSKNWEATLSREQQLVLCCSRAAVHPSANPSIRTLVQRALKWPDVAAYSARHHLSPVVYEGVAGAASDVVPGPQLDLLRRAAESSAARGMALVQEWLRLLEGLEAAQIPVVSHKGPVLAWRAYGSFIRREYSDLDFAVPQKFIPDVAAMMQAAGYLPQFDPREAHAGQNGFAPGQYAFSQGSQGPLVEFHTERTLRYFPRPLDLQELTERGAKMEISGRRVRTFSIEDTLVMLCVHGAKHFWERIAWVLDIAKLAALDEVDWARLQEIAAKMECTRVLRLGLFLAHDVLAAPLPQRWREEIARDRRVRALAGRVVPQYAGISDPGAGILSRAMFRIQTRDAIGQGVRHLTRLTMSPTERDRETFSWPRWLAPLYPLARPWRLLREYGLRPKGR